MSRRRTNTSEAPLLAWGDALRATKARRRRGGQRLAIGSAGLALLILPLAFPPAPRLVWNASASAPVGLYRVSPGTMPGYGDMVVAHVPLQYRRMAAERHYLPANVPLVKRVAAIAGDDICAIGTGIFANGHRIADRLTVDGQGRRLPQWQGCVRLRGRQLLLLMDRPGSFDGRYFGPTDGDDFVGKAWLLWRR